MFLDPQPREDERIFIASIHWNSAGILELHWNGAIIDLISRLGPNNVYVSIFEGGSWDGTKEALRDLDTQLEQLGVRRTLMLGNATHNDELV